MFRVVAKAEYHTSNCNVHADSKLVTESMRECMLHSNLLFRGEGRYYV